MIDTVYFRAGASCLPFVGPIISIINIREIQHQISAFLQNKPLIQLRCSIIILKALAAGMTNNLQVLDESKQEIENEDKRLTNIASALQKGRIYAICGIVGDVLTVATTVGLVYKKYLSPESAVFLTFNCVMLARWHKRNLPLSRKE